MENFVKTPNATYIDSDDLSLVEYRKENGVGIIVAEPLAQGFLTGKYNKESSSLYLYLNMEIYI